MMCFEGFINADDVRAAFCELDLNRQRAIVHALMTIKVHPTGRANGKVFNPDAIEIIWK